MISKTIMSVALAVFISSLCSCADLMVIAGLQKAAPPVTDSAYFNGQVETLLERIQSAKSRSFRKAAVFDFTTTDGKVPELGKILSAKLGERAMAKSYFRIAPPAQVKEAIRKLKIVYTGELEQEQVKALGDELGVDAIITGVLYDLQKGSDVDLSVNVTHTTTGDLVSAASVNIYRSKQVQTLIQQF